AGNAVSSDGAARAKAVAGLRASDKAPAETGGSAAETGSATADARNPAAEATHATAEVEPAVETQPAPGDADPGAEAADPRRTTERTAGGATAGGGRTGSGGAKLGGRGSGAEEYRHAHRAVRQVLTIPIPTSAHGGNLSSGCARPPRRHYYEK